MSSVAGFIFEHTVPLANLFRSLDAMSRRLPSVHIGKYGTGLGFLFACDDPTVVEKLKNDKPSEVGIAHIRALQISGQTFIEVLCDIPKGLTTEEIFRAWGLFDLQTHIAFAEQTMSKKNGITAESPAMVVLDDFALAACGAISWVVDETEEGQRMKEIARSNGIMGDTGAPVYTVWARKEFTGEHGPLGIIKNIPTIQATLILDGTNRNEPQLIAVRRDTRENNVTRAEERTSYLYYVAGTEGCAMASTTEGVGALIDRFEGPMELRAVPDMSMVFYNIPEGISILHASAKERI